MKINHPGELKPETDLKPFEEGVLCYVVLRNYNGEAPIRWIMHEADVLGEGKSFGYGAKRTWVISPAGMLGMSTSEKKKLSSKLNGKMGGRPAVGKRWIGLKDEKGRHIMEGDRLSFIIPKTGKVYATGVVEYSAEFAAFRLQYDKPTKSGAVSGGFSGYGLRLEK